MTDAPGPAAPPARYVAVAIREDDPAAAVSEERRSADRRLREAARRDALRAGAAVALFAAAACAALAAAGGAQRAATAFALGGAAAAIGLAASIAALRRASTAETARWADRLALALATTLVASLSAGVWFVHWASPSPAAAGAAAAIGALAIAAATALAPLPRAARAAALPPLSLAAAALAQGGAWGLAASALVVALFALQLAGRRHRHWQHATGTLIARDRRIAELERALGAAERADSEKSRFLGIASHDLRQPVHALGLFAATLDKRLHGSPDQPLVRNIMRAVDGLDRSFDAMLDISRLDVGTIEPNLQHFPLRDLFRRLHMRFAGQAEVVGLGLRFSPGGKAVTSDAYLLERILGNLVQNALKYTERGGVVVVARSTARRVNVEVWDTGRGIAAAELPRIFDEFYQVGHSDRDRSQGLGMGLAIVRRLATLLRLELVIVSRPGRGTMFRVGIPKTGLAEIQDATVAADTVPGRVSEARSVLVVDDEEAIREGLALLLEEWGYHAVACASVEQIDSALAALHEGPDLVISDLHLGPGPDGLAAIAAVRRAAGRPVPAILVTGDTSREEIRRLMRSGHPVLFKPVLPRKLYDAVIAQIP